MKLWLVSLLVLIGCASNDIREHEEKHCDGWTHNVPTNKTGPIYYEWQKSKPASIKPWITIYVDNPNDTCQQFGAFSIEGHIILGCAIWKPINCIIILPKGS